MLPSIVLPQFLFHLGTVVVIGVFYVLIKIASCLVQTEKAVVVKVLKKYAGNAYSFVFVR